VSTLSELKELLVTANHILAREGVVDAFGHVSVRHPERPGCYLLSCSRSPALVRAEDVMEFDLEGVPAGGDQRSAYLERFIHGAVYERRPDVHAVIHNHSHELLPYSVTDTPLRPLIHVAGSIGAHVPVWDIAERLGDTSLLVTDMAKARDLAERLDSHTAVLMRGHGAAVTGDSIRTAVLRAIYLQINARVDLQARALGPVKYLSAGEIAQSLENLLGSRAAERAWEYFKSRVESEGDES
jgi:ribulose-5-phosphate 4-epimerase/fuculose-1-phosphate aldolase